MTDNLNGLKKRLNKPCWIKLKISSYDSCILLPVWEAVHCWMLVAKGTIGKGGSCHMQLAALGICYWIVSKTPIFYYLCIINLCIINALPYE